MVNGGRRVVKRYGQMRVTIPPMKKYRSLAAWCYARELCVSTILVTGECESVKRRFLFDQLRRAALSVEANLVEGYALSTSPQFRRHLRIALGSAAEVEAVLNVAEEVSYLPTEPLHRLQSLADKTIGALYGLLRKS
jgi:four helix bundle protein